MRLKFDVTTLLKYFFAEIETQFGKKIQRVRFDNGSEFFNANYNEFFKLHGVIHESSCPHISQQNDVVERRHKYTYLRLSKLLSFQASFSNRFWGLCIQVDVYVLTRTPSTILGDVSPFEKLYEKSPSLDHNRVVGCLCFATNLTKQR
ncbi:hypothetical protein AABB24_029905 [Solanum stoloniferum]|uniref:Integrase catalytic domain-containing protein n=1 Tax=Solanum stoloniferum TaxID=62892 RepID=A0ABD2S036_9SOLN